MPEVGHAGKLVGDELRIVDEEVDVSGQLECGVVKLALTVRAGADVDGCVVGEIGDGRVPVADAEAEGLSALVGDLAREKGESLYVEGLAVKPSERPAGT